MVVLTNEERLKFMRWLQTEADSNEVLAAQADKLGIAGGAVAKRLKVIAACCMIVHTVLGKIEVQTIEGPQEQPKSCESSSP